MPTKQTNPIFSIQIISKPPISTSTSIAPSTYRTNINNIWLSLRALQRLDDETVELAILLNDFFLLVKHSHLHSIESSNDESIIVVIIIITITFTTIYVRLVDRKKRMQKKKLLANLNLTKYNFYKKRCFHHY